MRIKLIAAFIVFVFCSFQNIFFQNNYVAEPTYESIESGKKEVVNNLLLSTIYPIASEEKLTNNKGIDRILGYNEHKSEKTIASIFNNGSISSHSVRNEPIPFTNLRLALNRAPNKY